MLVRILLLAAALTFPFVGTVHVEGDAKTRPMRWARMASLPVGTWRKSGEVTMTRISGTFSDVNSCGENRGHDE